MSTFTLEQLSEIQELIKNAVGSNVRSRKRNASAFTSSENSSENTKSEIEPIKIDSIPLPTHMSYSEFVTKPESFRDRLSFNEFKKLSDVEIIEYTEMLIRSLYGIGALYSYEAYLCIFIRNLRDSMAFQTVGSQKSKFVFKENHYRIVLSFFGYNFSVKATELEQEIERVEVYNSLVSALIKLCNGEHLEFKRPSKKFTPVKPRPSRKNKKQESQESQDPEEDDIDFDEDIDEDDVNENDEDVNMEEEEHVDDHDDGCNEDQASKKRRVDSSPSSLDAELTQVYYDSNNNNSSNTMNESNESEDSNNNNSSSNTTIESNESEDSKNNNSNSNTTIESNESEDSKNNNNSSNSSNRSNSSNSSNTTNESNESNESNEVKPVEEKKKPVPLVPVKKTFTLAAAPYLKSMLPTTTNATTSASTFEKWEPKTVDRTLSVRLKSGVVMKYADWKRANKNRKPDQYDINESYVEFQQSNGEWKDLESYYIKFIKDVNNENMEGKSFDCICAKYKFYRDKL